MSVSPTAANSATTAVESPGLGQGRARRLLPIAFVTYSLAYLDRSNFSIGVAGGMKHDLHITSSIASLIGASFFLGYFLLQIPGTVYAERRGVRNLIFWSTLAWGILAAAQGLVSDVTVLLALRFALGAVEAAVLPAMVVFLARWFTRRERGKANAILILGNPVTVLWLNALSGYLVQAAGWREMFVVEGLPAVIWAFAFRALVSEDPSSAKWLAEDERQAVTAALAAEQSRLTRVRSYGQVLRSLNVWLLSAQYLLWSLGVYGFVLWLPTIVKAGSGQGMGATGLLSAIPFAIAALLMVVNSRASDRGSARSPYVWPWLLGAAAAFYGSYLAGPDHFWIAFVFLIVAGGALYAPYGPYFAFVSELVPREVSGAAVACVNSAGALGGFVGTYLVGWLTGATGGTGAAYLLMAASMAGAALLMIPVHRAHRRTTGEG